MSGSFVTFENTFITYMLFLPAIFLIATIAAIVLSIFDRKFKTTYSKGITKISLTAMFLLYPSIGGKIFSVFQCHNVGKKRFFVPMPIFIANTMATFFQLLPKPLITRDQIKLLFYDNIPSGKYKTNS